MCLNGTVGQQCSGDSTWWDACCCGEGRACVLGLTVSARVSSELRPYHRSISSWRSDPAPDQHFEGDRELH